MTLVGPFEPRTNCTTSDSETAILTAMPLLLSTSVLISVPGEYLS